jgi:hypothetical protein
LYLVSPTFLKDGGLKSWWTWYRAQGVTALQ